MDNNEIKKLQKLILFKDAEIKLLKEELQNFKNIISYYPGIVVILNKYGMIEFINENGAKMLGYSQNELVGENWFEKCIPENVKESLKFVFDKIIEGEIEEYKYYENPVQTKYKTLKMIQWRNAYIKDEKGNINKTISYGMEITHKILTKNETEKKEIIEILNLLPEAIHLIDKEYTILYCNETFKKWNKILKLQVEMVGKKLFDVFPFLHEKVKEEYESVFNKGEILITREKNIFRDREIITETRKIPVFEKEKIVYVLTLIRDLSNFFENHF